MATGGESAIWTLDAATQKLVRECPRPPYRAIRTGLDSGTTAALWVNPDGAHAKTTLVYSATDGALLLTGDIDAYNQAHPEAPVAEAVSGFSLTRTPTLSSMCGLWCPLASR